MSYKNKESQKYEEYWKFTAAKTDFENLLFIQGLSTIINRIDNNDAYFYKDSKKPSSYKKLQESLVEINGWNSKDPYANARKEINTWVKLGFIEPELQNYHPSAKTFIESQSKFERDTLRAKIFLDNNKFGASVSKQDDCKTNRVKFLIDTLQKNGKLSKNELLGIMFTDPDDYDGSLNAEQLKNKVNEINKIGALKRKYNQLSHLKSALKCLDQYIVFINDEMHFRDDDNEIQQISRSKDKKPRSQIQQSVYRDELIIESNRILGESEDNSRCKCMLTGLSMSKSKIVASHIWHYRMCDAESEYDSNNGLLLGENADYYFDSGKISFSDEGVVLIGNDVPIEWENYFNGYKLNEVFLNAKRKEYLSKHRKIHNFLN